MKCVVYPVVLKKISLLGIGGANREKGSERGEGGRGGGGGGGGIRLNT